LLPDSADHPSGETAAEPYLSLWELSRWHTYGATNDDADTVWRRRFYDRWKSGEIPPSHPTAEPPERIDVAGLLSRLDWSAADLANALALSERAVSTWAAGQATPEKPQRRELQRLRLLIGQLDQYELSTHSKMLKGILREGAEGTLEIYGRSTRGGAIERIPTTALIDAGIDTLWRDGEAALLDRGDLGTPAWVRLRFRRENVLQVWPHLARSPTPHQDDALGDLQPVRSGATAPETTIAPLGAQKKERREDAGEAALRKAKYQQVHAVARRMFGNRASVPDTAAMAEELAKPQHKMGFKEVTIRQILNGAYPPAKRMGLGRFESQRPKHKNGW
jgi:hypothetical protein